MQRLFTIVYNPNENSCQLCRVPLKYEITRARGFTGTKVSFKGTLFGNKKAKINPLTILRLCNSAKKLKKDMVENPRTYQQ